MHKLTAAILPLAMVGCMSYNTVPYGKFDLSKKTMTIGRGGQSLLGSIKIALRQDGWRLAADMGPNVSESTITTDGSRTEDFNTFKTRYRLGGNYRQVDITITGEGVFVYDISIVDNETGEEVLTMAGRGIQSTIAERLVQAISANSR